MKAQTVHALIINKNNKTVFIQFLHIKAVSSIIKRKYVRYFIAEFLISWYYICMKENLTHYRTCVCNVNYHMVWSVKYLKGISGRKLFEYFPEIRNQLWKGELWNHSYYVETVGTVSEENIRRYIEHQSKAY